MKHLVLIALALILIACDPEPAAQTPSEPAKPPSATWTPKPSATEAPTATDINQVFQTATPLRATNIALGTQTQATSSIYGDATNYANTQAAFQETATRYPLYQTATAHAAFLNAPPTVEIITTPTGETWEVVQNVNVRPDCSTTKARLRLAVAGELLQTKPDVIFSDGGGIEWRILASGVGCVAVRSGSNVFMVKAG